MASDGSQRDQLVRIAAAPGTGRGGEILRLPGRTWLIPLGGLVLTLFLMTVSKSSPFKAFAPFILSSVFTWFFFYDRPPRFLGDWLTSRVRGRHAELVTPRRRAAMRRLHPLGSRKPADLESATAP